MTSIDDQLLDMQLRAMQQNASGVNTTPIDPGEESFMSKWGRNTVNSLTGATVGHVVNVPQVERFSEKEEALMKRGVDVSQGAPAGRFEASFSANPVFAANSFKKKLAEKGVDTEVRVEDGDVYWLNPETKRWTAVDASTMELGDFADMPGEALSIGGEVTGSLLGAAGGTLAAPGAGTVAGEVAGSAGGAFAGEQAKLRAGRMLGANEGLTDEQINQMARDKAATAGMFAVAGVAGGRLYNKYKRGKSVLTRDEAVILEREARESDEIIEEINKIGPFNPTVGQRTGDDAMLDLEEAARTGDVGVSEQAKTLARQNEATLEKGAQELTPTPAISREEVGADIKGEFGGQGKARAKQTEELVQKTKTEAELATRSVFDEEQFGAGVKKTFVEMRKQAKGEEDVAWQSVRDGMGYNEETALSQVKIPQSAELKKVLNSLSAEAKESIRDARASKKKGLVSGKLMDKQESVLVLPPEVKKGLPLQGDKLDLYNLSEEISDLKRLQRDVKINELRSDPVGRDIQRLRKALEKTRNDHLGQSNPELLSKILDAEQKTSQRATMFDRGLVGELFRETAEGVPVIKDAKVFAQILQPGSVERATAFAGMLKQHPDKLQAVRDGVFSLYRSKFTNNGLPSADLHRKFLDEYGDVITPYFGKADMKKLSVLGEFGNTILKQKAQQENITRMLKKRFGERFKNTNSEELTKGFFTTKISNLDARALRSFLKMKNPEALKGFQERVLNDTLVKMKTGGKLNATKMGEIIEKHGDGIRGILGPDDGNAYIHGMKKIMKGLQMVEKQGAAPIKGGMTVVQSLTHGLIGPLSRKSRIKTGAVALGATSARRTLWKLATDPVAMRKFISLSNKKHSHAAVGAFLSSIGASALSEVEVPEQQENQQ